MAQRLKEYAALGIDTFILSGYPHLEEAYRVAELLFPLLPLENSTQINAAQTQHFVGEVVANDLRPTALPTSLFTEQPANVAAQWTNNGRA
ncbi:MAG: hypothetical protein U0175_01625 [Caldilineaceae bacterium]